MPSLIKFWDGHIRFLPEVADFTHPKASHHKLYFPLEKSCKNAKGHLYTFLLFAHFFKITFTHFPFFLYLSPFKFTPICAHIFLNFFTLFLSSWFHNYSFPYYLFSPNRRRLCYGTFSPCSIFFTHDEEPAYLVRSATILWRSLSWTARQTNSWNLSSLPSREQVVSILH